MCVDKRTSTLYNMMNFCKMVRKDNIKNILIR